MKNTDIGNLIKKIQANPLYYFSLGSKELFHSNFWYWLSTINPQATLNLFTDCIDSKELKFLREKEVAPKKDNKRRAIADLYIETENKAIIIENKIKDYPKDDQLQRLSEHKNGNKETFLILVTLLEYQGKLHNFEQITYRELSEKLDPEKFTQDEILRAYISNYKELILDLADIMPQELLEMYDFAPQFKNDKYTHLRDIKFAEVYYKYRASHFCGYIKQHIKHQLFIDYSINNGSATIDARIRIYSDITGDFIDAGAQIERDQFRVTINGSLLKSKDPKTIESVNNYCEELWQKCDIDKKDTRGRNYRKYGSDFRYNYNTGYLSEGNKFKSYEILVKEISNVIDNALALGAKYFPITQ